MTTPLATRAKSYAQMALQEIVDEVDESTLVQPRKRFQSDIPITDADVTEIFDAITGEYAGLLNDDIKEVFLKSRNVLGLLSLLGQGLTVEAVSEEAIAASVGAVVVWNQTIKADAQLIQSFKVAALSGQRAIAALHGKGVPAASIDPERARVPSERAISKPITEETDAPFLVALATIKINEVRDETDDMSSEDKTKWVEIGIAGAHGNEKVVIDTIHELFAREDVVEDKLVDAIRFPESRIGEHNLNLLHGDKGPGKLFNQNQWGRRINKGEIASFGGSQKIEALFSPTEKELKGHVLWYFPDWLPLLPPYYAANLKERFPYSEMVRTDANCNLVLMRIAPKKEAQPFRNETPEPLFVLLLVAKYGIDAGTTFTYSSSSSATQELVYPNEYMIYISENCDRFTTDDDEFSVV